MDIETAYQLVQKDNPDLIAKEAEHWTSMAEALLDQAGRLRSNIGKVDSGVESESGRAYMEELRFRFAKLEDAAVVAAENSGAWKNIAEQVRANKQTIENTYTEWKKEKAKVEKSGGDLAMARLPYDLATVASVQATESYVAQQATVMKPPEEYKPMPDLGGQDSTVDSSGGGPGTSGPGGSTPNGPPPGGSAPDGPSPRPDSGGHGPQLQTPPRSPAPSHPGPGPTPAPPPHGGPPPVLPPGTLPPGTKPVLRPGGIKPPIPPGTKPTLPPSAKPTLPPGAKPPATMPPGSKPPGTLPPGGKPPASGPRPPQSTVKPVIGSRPGTTGMAPTGTAPRPGTTGVSRPVIGGRPGPTGMPGAPNAGTATGSRPAPTKALIGSNGVVSNAQRTQRAVRTPKAQFGGTGTNRSVISGVRQAFKPGTGMPVPAKSVPKRDEADPQHRPEGGDYQWTVTRQVVPGVISGGDWTDREHTPGTAAELRAESQHVDESATVARLSKQRTQDRKSSTTDEDYWELPTGGRGVVVRSKAERYDANDW